MPVLCTNDSKMAPTSALKVIRVLACCGVFQDVQYVQTEYGTVCLFHWFLHNESIRDFGTFWDSVRKLVEMQLSRVMLLLVFWIVRITGI
ncbi:uncharacterized protein [Malus domestica]|uniref:uncharacterized protein isoform X2 n=1 Tax=Malus domestica TaxID=3750 RepID=UPI003976B0EE